MKRQTKHQREAARLAAVLQRVEDIYAGAMGEGEPNPLNWIPDLASVGRVMQALQSRFGIEQDADIFRPWYLEEFANTQSLAELLVSRGLGLPRKEQSQ